MSPRNLLPPRCVCEREQVRALWALAVPHSLPTLRNSALVCRLSPSFALCVQIFRRMR